MDVYFSSILARNNINKPIIISKNTRLGIVLDIDYDNYYLVINNNIVNYYDQGPLRTLIDLTGLIN